jgi:hypothetical protein
MQFSTIIIWLLSRHAKLHPFFQGPADLFAHPSSFSCLLKTIFTSFLRARMCWPLLCLCRPFCNFDMSDSNPESCQSKQTRYCNLATHLPNQLSHPSLYWLLKTFPNEKWVHPQNVRFQNVRFQNVRFKTSETSDLQNVRFTTRQVNKMSGLQNVRSSKRPVAKKTSIYILYLWLVEICRFCCSRVRRGCV